MIYNMLQPFEYINLSYSEDVSKLTWRVSNSGHRGLLKHSDFPVGRSNEYFTDSLPLALVAHSLAHRSFPELTFKVAEGSMCHPVHVGGSTYLYCLVLHLNGLYVNNLTNYIHPKAQDLILVSNHMYHVSHHTNYNAYLYALMPMDWAAGTISTDTYAKRINGVIANVYLNNFVIADVRQHEGNAPIIPMNNQLGLMTRAYVHITGRGR